MEARKLREELEAKREEIRSLSTQETLSEDDETRLTTLTEEYKPLEERTVAAETRAREIENITAQTRHVERGIDAPAQINRNDPFEQSVERMSRSEKRDAAMRVFEQDGKRLNSRQGQHVDQLLNEGGKLSQEISERMLLTQSPAYRSAFAKAMTQTQPVLNAEEAAAVNRFREWEARAASEGTTTAGGFGVPILIDPTVILTSGAADAPILNLADVITVSTNVWKGVSSAGVSWSYDAEASEVSDDAPTLAQPSITVYSARGFIPFSVEVEQDYPGFESEMMKLLNQGYIDLLAAGTANGDGSSKPRGVIAAMAAQTSPAHIAVTTAGTVGASDVKNVYYGLPERFRGRSTWVMHGSVESKIRALGNSLAMSDYTVNLLADGTSVLTGRPVVVTDYASNFTGQTTTFSYAVLGDFSNFKIIQRAGMTLELVPHLLATANGRPNLQRGWIAYARHGHDVVAANAFRLLANTTSG